MRTCGKHMPETGRTRWFPRKQCAMVSPPETGTDCRRDTSPSGSLAHSAQRTHLLQRVNHGNGRDHVAQEGLVEVRQQGGHAPPNRFRTNVSEHPETRTLAAHTKPLAVIRWRESSTFHNVVV